MFPVVERRVLKTWGIAPGFLIRLEDVQPRPGRFLLALRVSREPGRMPDVEGQLSEEPLEKFAQSPAPRLTWSVIQPSERSR